MHKIYSWLIAGAIVLAACGGGGQAVTGDDVVSAFKAANLEAEDARAMTKDDYGFAPFVCKGTRFFIPSLGAESGGRIFVCDNAKDRDALNTYYTEIGKSSAAFFSWIHTKGNVLVQINGNLPEEKANEYKAALEGME